MRGYTAHLKPGRTPVLVPEGFSWAAWLFGPLWLAAHRAWVPAARAVTLAATGHNGCVTKAREFAAEVAGLLAGLPPADAADSTPSRSETVRAYRVS